MKPNAQRVIKMAAITPTLRRVCSRLEICCISVSHCPRVWGVATEASRDLRVSLRGQTNTSDAAAAAILGSEPGTDLSGNLIAGLVSCVDAELKVDAAIETRPACFRCCIPEAQRRFQPQTVSRIVALCQSLPPPPPSHPPALASQSPPPPSVYMKLPRRMLAPAVAANRQHRHKQHAGRRKHQQSGLTCDLP